MITPAVRRFQSRDAPAVTAIVRGLPDGISVVEAKTLDRFDDKA